MNRGWARISARACLISALGLVGSGCASAQEIHPEYAFSASIPEGATRCPYYGADADTGFFLLLDHKSCSGDEQSEGFISVTYKPNADTEKDIGGHYSKVTFCKPGPKDAEWTGAIDGLKTAVCRSIIGMALNPEDETRGVAVSALGGTSSSGAPRFLYSIRLVTNGHRYEQDVATFKRFVCSIDILGEGTGSPLCARLSD